MRQLRTPKWLERFREPLRVFSMVGFFLLALDSCIALNRWWLEEAFRGYLLNLILMVVGFSLFTVLAAKTKLQAAGLACFCVAVYFICNYEIGGPSKYFLTPFDPLLHVPQTFPRGDPRSYVYRRAMAYLTSIVSALLLGVTALRRKPQNNVHLQAT